jgi:hypothetical protein
MLGSRELNGVKITHQRIVFAGRYYKGTDSAEGVIQAAREKTAWILEHHEPEPLDQDSQIELEKIMAASDLEIK